MGGVEPGERRESKPVLTAWKGSLTLLLQEEKRIDAVFGFLLAVGLVLTQESDRNGILGGDPKPDPGSDRSSYLNPHELTPTPMFLCLLLS